MPTKVGEVAPPPPHPPFESKPPLSPGAFWGLNKGRGYGHGTIFTFTPSLPPSLQVVVVVGGGVAVVVAVVVDFVVVARNGMGAPLP